MRALIAGLVALATTAGAWAQDKPAPLVQEAIGKGFTTCAGPLDRTVRFVHEDDDNYAYLGIWATEDTDDSSFAALTSEQMQEGATVSTFSVVKTPTRRCDVTFTQVIPVLETSCERLKAESFANWRFYTDLGEAEVLEDPTSPTVSLVLSPLGPNGCLVVKHVMLFDVKN